MVSKLISETAETQNGYLSYLEFYKIMEGKEWLYRTYTLPLFSSLILKCPKFWTFDCIRENPSRIKVRLKNKHEEKQNYDSQKLYCNFCKEFAWINNSFNYTGAPQ